MQRPAKECASEEAHSLYSIMIVRERKREREKGAYSLQVNEVRDEEVLDELLVGQHIFCCNL